MDMDENVKTNFSQNHRSGMVALIGPPNSGKSTLLNYIVGQKVAIVTPKPQTTRNRITGIFSREDAQIIFIDTPGIHTSKIKLNQYIVKSAWQALNSSDCILLLLDGPRYIRSPHLLEQEIHPIRQGLKTLSHPLIIGINKVDKVKDKSTLLPLISEVQSLFPEQEIFPLSAVKGTSVPEIMNRIKENLPVGPPLYPDDQISTLPLRFMAGEIVREKLFFALKEELPYSVAIDVEKWLERDNLTEIGVTIYVTRANHKGIVIGKRGAMLKEIGRKARLEIEEMIEGKVFLELWVKVNPNWHENVQFLSSLGLGA